MIAPADNKEATTGASARGRLLRSVGVPAVAGALAVSGSIKGAAGTSLAFASKNAWLSAYRYSLIIAAVVMGIATIIAYIALPDRAADDIPEEGFFEA